MIIAPYKAAGAAVFDADRHRQILQPPPEHPAFDGDAAGAEKVENSFFTS